MKWGGFGPSVVKKIPSMYRKVKILDNDGLKYSELQEFESLRAGDVFLLIEPDGSVVGKFKCIETKFQNDPAGVICNPA